MSRTTLCDPPAGWKERIKELGDQDMQDGELLLRVELALELMKFIGCDSETALAVPAILSGTPMNGTAFTGEQRLAIANVRQIVPYSASSAWRADLAQYRQLPDHWRHYNFPTAPINPERDEESDEWDRWEKRLICLARKSDNAQRHEAHKRLYHQCLTTRLPFHERIGEYATGDTLYTFRAQLSNEHVTEGSVRIPQPLLDALVKQPKPTWFPSEIERPREPVTINIKDDLSPIAAYFDERDRKLGRTSAQWQKRLSRIQYRHVKEDGTVDEAEPNHIYLNGWHHAAGMVASGKSTVVALVAGYIVREQPHKRVTIVVGDVQSAIRLANQLNSYFCDNPETDQPVAVPLLGRRSRNKHLRDLHESNDWQTHYTQNKPHWGERFLSTACLLQGLIPADDIIRLHQGQTILPGQEPCAALEQPKKQDRDNKKERVREKRLCPLYYHCPVHRATHDMPQAPIWITTPQAMTQGSIPRQAENRPIHIGEIVYERSDIVIFDEADAVMGVLDEVFAHDEDLSNGKTGRGGGIYDRLGMQTERFVIPLRANTSNGQLRWSHAQRGGQNAITVLLRLLNDGELAFLHRWVERDYFTPYNLFHRLSRRFAGCTEYVSPDEDEATKDLVEKCRLPFEQLFGRGSNPLNPKHIRTKPNTPAYKLWLLLRDIDAAGEDVFKEDLEDRCREWIQETYPDIEDRLIRLREHLTEEAALKETHSGKKRNTAQDKTAKRISEEVGKLYHLTYRLLFALTAALLDHHTHTIFQEWQSRTAPDEDDTQPHRNTPAILRDILPLPPIGRQFGTYYSPGDGTTNNNPNRLSFLSYTNIGRWYLLHFHELFSDLRQRPGPHVLALSGTSYLPDAVRLHVGSYATKPQGLLLPEKEAMDAIRKSELTYLPLLDGNSRPIRISGTPEGPEKSEALRTLARKLTSNNGGYLGSELAELRKLADQDKKLWSDRERILLLVNSYEQARIVAYTMRETWPAEKDRIFYLSRAESGKPDFLAGGKIGDDAPAVNSINRPDIETFGTHTNGRILIAPMNAIGRGYNILNKEGKTAAFGSIYFLIRPYPHPDDMTALAREMNRRTLDWAEDANFEAWNAATIEERFRKLRGTASEYWDTAQWRKYWRTLTDHPKWHCEPRKDLAAYTAGIIVQAAGRLLRGGVPFRAYFVDAAFATQAAKHPQEEPLDALEAADAPQTSMLAAVIVMMRDLVEKDTVAQALYEPLADALCDTHFRDGAFPFDDHWVPQEKK